jgi:DNA-binding Lrp family transcriptional regulator
MAKKALARKELRRRLLGQLQADCSQSTASLASKLGADASTVGRLRNELVAKKYVRAQKAILNPTRFQLHTLAFIQLSLERESEFQKKLAKLIEMPEVQEIHYIQGEFDFLIKIRVHSNAEVMSFIQEQLTSHHEVKATRTMITMGSPKETTDIPVGDSEN